MRRAILVSTAVLTAIFLGAGCGGGGSQAEKEHHARHSHGAQLVLYPEGDSGVKGTATFEDASEGVVVKLELRNLPKPDTLYLAHIHPGTCAQGEEGEGGALEHGEHGEHAEEGKGHEHMEEGYEHGGEIEYPLSQVKSNSESDGSSTTTLHHTSIDKLFLGGPKHVNVHEAGTGDPPILACADLKGAFSPAKKKQDERGGARQAQTTTPEPTVPNRASGGATGEEQAGQSEADCRLVLYVADQDMNREEAEAFSELLADMIRTMESPSWTAGDLRNAALDHLAVPRYPECKDKK
jgi:hypothetical protein